MDQIQVIRTHTKAIHQELENLPCMQLLINGKCNKTTYTDILNAFYLTHLTIKYNLRSSIENQFLQSLDLKISALMQDLEYFERLADSRTQTLEPITQPLDIWGLLYVLEGSNKGSLTISKILMNKYNYTQTSGAHFFNLYCQKAGNRWQQFSKQFCTQINSDKELNAAIETAIIIFKLFKKSLSMIGTGK